MVAQRRDLRVRVNFDKAAGELVAFADTNQPGVILSACYTQRQQLFQHDRHFLPIRRAQRVELEWVITNGQHFLMRGAGNRTVDIGERAAVILFPFPYFRWLVVIVGHTDLPL